MASGIGSLIMAAVSVHGTPVSDCCCCTGDIDSPTVHTAYWDGCTTPLLASPLDWIQCGPEEGHHDGMDA